MSDGRVEAERCRAVRKDGQPCTLKALEGGLCFAHSPQRVQSRVKGGQATRKSERAARLLPERLRPVADLLADALEEVHNGALDPRAAAAMASLASALVRVCTAGELEARLEQLERVVTQAGGRTA